MPLFHAPILPRWTLRPRVGKGLGQGHRASQYQSCRSSENKSLTSALTLWSWGTPGGNAHLAACRRKRSTRWGGGFLQPAPLQHGSAAVQHLCGDATVDGAPEARSRGPCGCRAVRAGAGMGERFARAGSAGEGTRVLVRGMDRLRLGIYMG